MSNLREVEEILAGLSRAEKAQLLKLIVQDLADSFPGVESAADICGGEASRGTMPCGSFHPSMLVSSA